MNIKSKRILAVSTIIALAGLLVNPSFAEDPVPTVLAAVETTAAPTTGTIYVENIVINDNLGTKTAADFELSITHFGADIAGSPFRVTETSGTHFVLAPGTYVVAIESMEGYLGTWSGEGVTNGFVDLKAGQEITFIRNTYDNGVATPAYIDPESTVEPTVDPMTDDGGLLLSAAGAIAFRKSSPSN